MHVPPSLPAEVLPLLRSLVLSPDPVFVTDRHNRVVLWNKSAERLLAYTEEETVGLACAGVLEGCDVFGNRYCSESCPVTQTAMRGETVRHFGLRLKAKGGRMVLVDVTILNLPVPPPERFFLAHVLHPAEAADLPQHPSTSNTAPPREALVVARESLDARARRLTAREVEVLGMLAAGHMTPEIASRLHISSLTARNHIQNVLDKLEVHSKAEAVAFAFQKHLL